MTGHSKDWPRKLETALKQQGIRGRVRRRGQEQTRDRKKDRESCV